MFISYATTRVFLYFHTVHCKTICPYLSIYRILIKFEVPWVLNCLIKQCHFKKLYLFNKERVPREIDLYLAQMLVSYRTYEKQVAQRATMLTWEKKWKYQFFRRLRAANSVVRGQIWQNFKLIQALMYVIITCKYEKDPIKNNREKVATPFFKL